MGLSGCCGIVKFLVLLLNLIFWLIGLAILVLSIFMLTDPTYIISMAQDQNNYYIALYIFLSIGAVMVFLAFLGCCGVFKESQCMLVSFFCLLLIVIVAEVAAGSWAFYNKDKLNQMIRVHVEHTVKEEYSVIHSRTAVFDVVQQNLQCCGASGPSDWSGSYYNRKSKATNNAFDAIVASVAGKIEYSLPESCCKTNVSQIECENARTVVITSLFNHNINSSGCVDKVIDYFKSNSTLFMTIGFIVVAVEILGLILSLLLCCAVQRNDHYKA